jgi:hypothetical protein
MNVTQRERAEAHKPKTPAQIERAAHELVGRGWGEHTVAHILDLDVNALRQLLGEQAA